MYLGKIYLTFITQQFNEYVFFHLKEYHSTKNR